MGLFNGNGAGLEEDEVLSSRFLQNLPYWPSPSYVPKRTGFDELGLLDT